MDEKKGRKTQSTGQTDVQMQFQETLKIKVNSTKKEGKYTILYYIFHVEEQSPANKMSTKANKKKLYQRLC